MINLCGVFECHVNKHFSLTWASAEANAKKPFHNCLKEDLAVVVHMYRKFKISNKISTKQWWKGSTSTAHMDLSSTIPPFKFHSTRPIPFKFKIQFKHCAEQPITGQLVYKLCSAAFTWESSNKQSFGFNGNILFWDPCVFCCWYNTFCYKPNGTVSYEGEISTCHWCPDK